MQYLALLIHEERELTPDERAVAMSAYQAFHRQAAGAIRGGDALAPVTQPDCAVRITGGPDAPVVTDGPFPEGAEVAGGYYVFEAEDLDEALALARRIPAAEFGAVEVWPLVHPFEPSRRVDGNDWLALLLEPLASAHAPGTPEWQAVAARHGDFHASAGDHVVGGAALHDRSTATTVRVRGGEVIVTDGPFAEGAEVASGFYLLSAVAALARWSGDLTVAEDAVQEACAEAFRTWHGDGVPDNPGGWLVAVARNRARDRLRRESVRPGKELAASKGYVDEMRARTERTDPHPVRDDELRMMFTCAHPALDRPSQLALTLRLVSGLTVTEIARALL